MRFLRLVCFLAVGCLFPFADSLAAPNRILSDSDVVASPTLVSAPFRATGNLITGRWLHSATLLPDGEVLIAGGTPGTDSLSSAELYDPFTGTFRATATPLLTARQRHTATLLLNGKVLITGGITAQNTAPLASAELYDPATQSFALTGSMTIGRIYHTATSLADGRVLVVGGGGVGSGTAELYDPNTGTFVSTTGPLNNVRLNHTATLLSNGKVLIAGGLHVNSALFAELFDPSTGTFSNTGVLGTRFNHTATRLPNGNVLIAGGFAMAGGLPSNPIATASIYDVASGTFSITGSLPAARYQHTATLLPNGRVLIAGGFGNAALATAAIYDPDAGSFSSTANDMAAARNLGTATLLSNGTVLVAGGGDQTVTATADLYDPAQPSVTATGSLNTGRYCAATSLLPDGKVLIAGGAIALGSSQYLNTAEVYDPSNGTFTTVGPLAVARANAVATLLLNGKVLVVGGARVGNGVLASAELYDPLTHAFTSTGSMVVGRERPVTTLLPDGRVLVSGGWSGALGLPSAEIYSPVTGQFTMQQSMTTGRAGHSATLLPNGKVLIAAGMTTFTPALTSAELFDPATGQFTATGGLHSPRFDHRATLLPNGKVLIAGNWTSESSAELYDPASGTFSLTGSLTTARSLIVATLLASGNVLVTGPGTPAEIYDTAAGVFRATAAPVARSYGVAPMLLSGKVLLAAGLDQTALITAAQLFDPAPDVPDTRRPLITGGTAVVHLPGAVALTGCGFRGDSEATSGTSGSSATNVPLLKLQRLDNDEVRFVRAASPPTDAAFTSATITNAASGYYRASLITNGIASAQRLILFTTIAEPTLSTITPNAGPASGGETVTISGTNLSAATVVVDATAATITQNTANSVSFTTPPHSAGLVTVTVTTAGGSVAGSYLYRAAPTISTVTFCCGPTAGGQGLGIYGTNLSGATITIGGIAALVMGAADDFLSFVTPPHAAGVVNIIVTTPGGTATKVNAYTYVDPPSITSIAPHCGRMTGGQKVTITGTNLSAPVTVEIDGTPVVVAESSPTSVIFITPPHATGSVSVTVLAGGGSATAVSGFVFVAPSSTMMDGRSDVVWRNGLTGAASVWMMNGTIPAAGSGVTSLQFTNNSFVLAGMGDFNGDGKADLVWRNNTTGDTFLWLMNGTAAIAGSGAFNYVPYPWQIAGVGDFNGDGKADLLWRNMSTGANSIWLLDGLGIQPGSGTLNAVGDLAWRVAGIGDFNGDGRSDILWRNDTQGVTSMWMMNGTSIGSGSGATFLQIGNTWRVAAVGDLNGDSFSDIFWRNVNSGENIVWLQNGVNTIAGSGGTLAVPDPAWNVAAIGDFNGDGHHDVVWRNNITGDTTMWIMNGPVVCAGSGYVATIGAPWDVAAPK